ncbi:hypothetical protein [Roseivirga pacifica]|uniref:hypothetical protein n=1 Tax=Roseivirga pacifica TaxID=1267423 RepID=UPI003BAD1AB1
MDLIEGQVRYHFFKRTVKFYSDNILEREFKIKTKCFSNNLIIKSSSYPNQYFKFEHTNFRKRQYRLNTVFQNEKIAIDYNHKTATIKTTIKKKEFSIVFHSNMNFTFIENNTTIGCLDSLSTNFIVYKDKYVFYNSLEKGILYQLVLYSYICSSILNINKVNNAYGNGTESFQPYKPFREGIDKE